MRACVRLAFVISSTFFLAAPARSQSLGNAGTVDGSVVDPSGAAISKAEIQIHNPVSGYSQSTISANDGSFHLINISPNQYHLEIKAWTASEIHAVEAVHKRPKPEITR